MDTAHCDCEDGSRPFWFFDPATKKSRFALLPCRICGSGDSDMGNGRKEHEIEITEAQYRAYQAARYAPLRQAA